MIAAYAMAAGAVVLLALALVRLFAGAALYDRHQAVSAMVMRVALVCAALAVAAGERAWLDTTVALMLAALVLSVAALKFHRARSFQPPLAHDGGE